MITLPATFMELSNYFKNIIERQELLGYHMPKILRTPADKSAVAETERILKLTFNQELNQLYSIADGVNLDYITPSGLTGLIPIYNFLSLSDATEYYKVQVDFDEAFHNWETNFKPGKHLFPFLQSDGNCYWVDLNEETENYSNIYWTNTLAEDPEYLFSSLTSMFKTISDCYDNGIFKLDEEGYLDCDYNAWGHVAQKNNPEIKYWSLYNSQQ